MTEISFLDRFVRDNCPMLHGHSRHALMFAAQALMRGAQLTLTGLGRRLAGESRTKHKIKRIDRLLGNKRVHEQRVEVYRALAAKVLGERTEPVVLVDWSDFEPGHRWLILRASVAIDGRALTVYEEVYPLSRYNNPTVHQKFLRKLKSVLPKHCQPIVVTDAGFRGPWFNAVRKLGWHYVGRVRNRIKIRRFDGKHWQDSHEFYPQASAKPVALGRVQLSSKNPYEGNLHLVGESKRKRHRRDDRYRDPWLLVTSLEPDEANAQQVVSIYRKRMQIELSFRDLKDDRWSFALVYARSRSVARKQMPLLIALLATFALWLIGLVARAAQWHRHFQANTVSNRHVLSCLFLGREVYRSNTYCVTHKLLKLALRELASNTLEPRHCNA